MEDTALKKKVSKCWYNVLNNSLSQGTFCFFVNSRNRSLQEDIKFEKKISVFNYRLVRVVGLKIVRNRDKAHESIGVLVWLVLSFFKCFPSKSDVWFHQIMKSYSKSFFINCCSGMSECCRSSCIFESKQIRKQRCEFDRSTTLTS